MKSFLLPRETQGKFSAVRRVLSDRHCDMEALIVSGGVMRLHLFWNSAVNQCVLVSNSGDFVHAENILFNVTVSFGYVVYTNMQHIHPHTQLCAHMPQQNCSRLPLKTFLAPLKGGKKKKVV